MSDETAVVQEELHVRPYVHQMKLIMAPRLYPKRRFFFMVAGYNAGKSFTIVLLMIVLAIMYNNRPITVGIGGGTMKLLHRTTLSAFQRLAAILGLPYEYNKNDSIITIGTTDFVIIATNEPDQIYAHNFSIFLGDELDELPQVKAIETFKAVQERTRTRLPPTSYVSKNTGKTVTVEGRSAYSMFLTTAQGLKGTYQIIEEMKMRGDGYWLIHARSEDNLSVDKEWLESMRSIYNEVERQVFLEGRFANLLTGRVYYGYDEEKHRLKAVPFDVRPEDVIRIGQDLNAGYSRGVAVVKRMWPGPDGRPRPTLFAVENWSFGQIGHAPKIIRNAYPANDLHWYPDQSGKEVLEGYRAEIGAEGIVNHMGGANPSVVDRILVENKLFEAGRLYLFPHLHPLSMALKTRQYDEKGDPVKRQGENDPSHYCDGFEYVLWQIVAWDPDFRDFYRITRSGRAEMHESIPAMLSKMTAARPRATSISQLRRR